MWNSVVKKLLRAIRPAKPLPQLDYEIEESFHVQSFVAPNPWMKARARLPGRPHIVARLTFGVSPLGDRVYVDEMHVEESHRRQRFGSALLLHVASTARPGVVLPVTALHEVGTSLPFWNALRAGAVPHLLVTRDLRVSEMPIEARRWGHLNNVSRAFQRSSTVGGGERRP